MRSLRPLSGLLAGVVALAGVGAAIAQSGDVGRIGPDLKTTGNGHQLAPLGTQVGIGNFPTGGAVTRDGRYYWTVSTGRGPNDIQIVDIASGRVIQVVRLPGASGGIVADPSASRMYVSGVADSPDAAQKSPPGTPGLKGDVIGVYRYDASGHAAFDHLIAVPPPSGAPTPQNFPPTNTLKVAWPDRLAISPDGRTLLVPLNLADAAAIVDSAHGTVRYVATGNYPYGAAILRDGKTGLVSNETPGTVSVIDLVAGKKLTDIQVGSHLSHPEGIAVDPKADRAYVAVADSDQVAVIDTKSFQATRTLNAGRPEGLGTYPVALTVTPDGSQLLVAEAGVDAIAAYRLRGGSGLSVGAGPPPAPAFSLIGRIPTASYPTDVQVVPAGLDPCGTGARLPAASKKRKRRAPKRKHARKHATKHRRSHKKPAAKRKPAVKAPASCAKLLYVSSKGLGTGPNPNGPQPTSPNDSDDRINAFQYLPIFTTGSAGIADLPSAARIAALDPIAERQALPNNPESAPADTPLRPGGPIKHVFYIVRENRTYDQILGDDPRGNGDPQLTLFGKDNTPNAHALVQRFPLLDHVYANSDASIDGHFWTSSATVNDYVEKNWFQNYAGRNRPYDFIYSVTWPHSGLLFDQADRQSIPYFNYGEAIGDVLPFPDKDRTPAETQRVAQNFAHSDLGTNGCYPNDASIGKDTVSGQTVFDSVTPAGAPPGSESRAQCFQIRFASQLATNSVPAFNYMVLSNDHTRVLSPGAYTPQAMIADNDYGLGQIVQTIAHSSIWSSSAIFVIEDDSQDGADHVDAHRIPALVISPYAKQGAVVHTRYDFASVIRSMELILGMNPLSLFDATGTPMYDAFSGQPSNSAPFDATAPKVNLLATNPANTAAAHASARLSTGTDQIPQSVMDSLLWQAVHGVGAKPPPPGPNAVANG
jgi:DNA-binding beta-propeller fold protein YncE